MCSIAIFSEFNSMLKRVNTRAAEELERLNSICDRPHASSMARVTQAPTCEEENGESTGERGGGNSRRIPTSHPAHFSVWVRPGVIGAGTSLVNHNTMHMSGVVESKSNIGGRVSCGSHV